MGKKPLYIPDAGRVCLGLMRTFNAVTSFGSALAKKAVLTTESKITCVNGTALQHKIGATPSTSCNFKYPFTAQDGKTYIGQDSIDEARFNMFAKVRR